MEPDYTDVRNRTADREPMDKMDGMDGRREWRWMDGNGMEG